MHIELLDQAGVTILATESGSSGSAIGFNTGPTTSYDFDQHIGTSGILHSGSTPSDSAAAAYTLIPGNYVLRVQGGFPVGSCALNESIGSTRLTYILLSSAFDRIFADGFGAMG
jgi:hypothetical protein